MRVSGAGEAGHDGGEVPGLVAGNDGVRVAPAMPPVLEFLDDLIDRPDQEPYPARTFTIRASEIAPAGSSPEGTYEIRRGGRP